MTETSSSPLDWSPARGEAPVPWWFDRIVGAVLSVLIGFSLVGTVLALLGFHRVGPVLALGGAASYTVYSWLYRYERVTTRTTGGTAAAAAVALLAVATLVFNWANPSQQVLTDGETGTMVNAARQLSISGRLDVDGETGAFEGARVGFAADGFSEGRVGMQLRSQASHLLPALDAVVGWLGAGALTRSSAIWAAVAVLVFYWFAVRLLHTWTAVAVSAALALTLPFVQLARGGYPEILVLSFVFGGLGLLWGESRYDDPGRGVIIGISLGLPAMAGPRWAVVGVALAAFVVLELVEATRLTWSAARRRRRFLVALAAGYAVPLAIGGVDIWMHGVQVGGGPYRALAVAAAIVAVVIAMFGVVSRSVRAPRFAYADPRRAFAVVTAFVVLVGGALALYARPETHRPVASPAVEAVQEVEGVPVDGTRTYAEEIGQWLAWYLGPWTAPIGLAGVAMLTLTFGEGRDRRTYLLLLVVVVTTFAVMADLGTDPIHIGVMRAFLPVTIPALLLGAGWVTDRLWEGPERIRTPARLTAVVTLAAVIAAPLFHLGPLAEAGDHVGALDSVEALCSEIGGDGAVLIAEDAADQPGRSIVQTLRGFCRVPAARALDLTEAELEALNTGWQELGRSLAVISAEPLRFGPEPTRIELTWESLERRVEARPRRTSPEGISLYLATGLGEG